MPIDVIEFNGQAYPRLQAEGYAMQYAIPFFRKFIEPGSAVLDIGCSKDEWKYPNAFPVDPAFKTIYDAYYLPEGLWEAILSSHCLEHLRDWVTALDYWAQKLKQGGFLGLYLPNMDYQQYWHPGSNRKHLHYLNPGIIKGYFELRKEVWCNVFVTEGYDLNGSFYAIAEKL